MKRLALLAMVAVLAGCGGSSKPTATTTTTPVPNPASAMRKLISSDGSADALFGNGKVKTLYQGSSWSVVQVTEAGRAYAVAFELLGGQWKPDRSNAVKVKILGPQPGTKVVKLPQVAIGIASPAPFVESAIWVDGTELFEKGGGSPTRGTIYGAPAKNLAKGLHVAVGFARTVTTGTAVAWVFRV